LEFPSGRAQADAHDAVAASSRVVTTMMPIAAELLTHGNGRMFAHQATMSPTHTDMSVSVVTARPNMMCQRRDAAGEAGGTRTTKPNGRIGVIRASQSANDVACYGTVVAGLASAARASR